MLTLNMKVLKDKYLKSRGGTAKFLNLFCVKCGKKLFIYQKDGPGPLKRLYLDRIREGNIQNSKLISCNCGESIGYQYIYPKESRPAIKLFVGTIRKQTIKNK